MQTFGETEQMTEQNFFTFQINFKERQKSSSKINIPLKKNKTVLLQQVRRLRWPSAKKC